MRPEDLNPDIISHRDKDDESIFTKKGETYQAMGEALNIGTTPVRLAELAEYAHSSVRSVVAQNPITPFFVLFRFLADPDFTVRQNAKSTLARAHNEKKLDLSDKGIMNYILKYEKDNLKAIEAFQEMKDSLNPDKDDA